MTLVELTLVTAWLLAALWTTWVLVLRYLESPVGAMPSTVELRQTALQLGKNDAWVAEMRRAWVEDNSESTRTAWLHALANTGSAVERRIAREFKRRGRLLLGPRRATEAKRAKARRNGGAR